MNYALFNAMVTPIYSMPYEIPEDGRGGLEDEGLYGHKCEIISNAGEWVRISAAYRYEGWVKRKYLTEISREEWENREKDSSLRFVTAPFADILALPKVQGRILASLSRGGIIRVTGAPDNSGWLSAETVNGISGFVKASLIGEYYSSPLSENESKLRCALTAAAKSYLGTQYRWGGKSPLGIDCSGLCSMAYMLCGIYIYRDADIKDGFPIHEIATDTVKSGDLLYFPGHVAMYLGDGNFIHSTAKAGSDGVVINSLREGTPGFRGDLLASMTAAGSIF